MIKVALIMKLMVIIIISIIIIIIIIYVREKMRVVYLNARSIRNKITEQFAIIAIRETWFDCIRRDYELR